MLDRTDAEGALGAQDTGRDGCRSDCVGCVATEQRRGEHVVVITSSQAGAARFSRRARAGVAVVLLAAIGATGCGGTAAREATRLDSSRQPAHGAQNTQASVATSDDIADGSAIAASVVRTQLDALMRQYDAATNALLARPSDAANPSASTTGAYLAVFAPGSAFASGALASWAREGVQGHSYQRGSRDQLVTTQLTSVEPVASNTVGFGVCVASSFVIVDSAGHVLESQGGIAAGHGVAVRVDGQWLLRDLSLSGSRDCSAEQSRDPVKERSRSSHWPST